MIIEALLPGKNEKSSSVKKKEDLILIINSYP
jgi:hypothetical protein